MRNAHKSLIAQKLAKRVGSAHSHVSPVSFGDSSLPAGLLDCLREHLAAGETHYTARPGIPELRAIIGREIAKIGGFSRDADGVIITHGEGEALYVTLLGLGINSECKLVIHGSCQHRPLLDLLGIVTVGVTDTNATDAEASYREIAAEDAGDAGGTGSDRFKIVSLGDLLFSTGTSTDSLEGIPDSAILIGSLDSVSGLDHFRLGFVAGPPNLVKRIQTW